MSLENKKTVVRNLVFFVIWGAGLSFWLIRYTNWFPVVGGLLGLTGGFAWIAFLANIIPEERIKALQTDFDQNILQQKRTSILLVVSALVFVGGFASWHGTLVIDTLGEDASRTVEICPAENCSEANVFRAGVRPRSDFTVLLSSGLLTASRYHVKLSGLPGIDLEITPFVRTFLVVPVELLSVPAILLRPTAIMSGKASSGEFVLIVKSDKKEFGRIDDYHGEAVWLGVAGDVEIPTTRIEKWRLELISQDFPPDFAGQWSTPKSLKGSVPLKTGATVTASIERLEADGSMVRQGIGTTVVHPPRITSMFPQEIVIDEVKTQ